MFDNLAVVDSAVAVVLLLLKRVAAYHKEFDRSSDAWRDEIRHVIYKIGGQIVINENTTIDDLLVVAGEH